VPFAFAAPPRLEFMSSALHRHAGFLYRIATPAAHAIAGAGVCERRSGTPTPHIRMHTTATDWREALAISLTRTLRSDHAADAAADALGVVAERLRRRHQDSIRPTEEFQHLHRFHTALSWHKPNGTYLSLATPEKTGIQCLCWL
jgi:hypothetical protein